MMILFVFDSCAENYKIDRLRVNSEDTVYLFPLTSITRITNTICEKIKSKGCHLEHIETASIINSAADNLRGKYIRFIAEFPGKIMNKGRNLKEFFAIDKYTTLWWFSLISEKNIYKSDGFNRLAQLDSIVTQVKHKEIKEIVLLCKSKKLEDALSRYARDNYIRFQTSAINFLDGLKARALKMQIILSLKHILILLNFAMNLFARIWKIKKSVGSLKRAMSFHDRSLLLITPYPNIDIPSAQKGIFKNKFYPYLQEILDAKGQNIVWAAIYVDNSSISFSDSMKYAEQFIKNGYVIFFLQEFNSIGIQIRALLTMLKNGIKFIKIESHIAKAHVFSDYNFYPLFRDDWYSSFTGYTGYEGILYYRIFRSLLNKVKAKKCLYLCEMHAWEKALISAREAARCTMPLYGYQSTIVSRMLLNYFNFTKEIHDDGQYAIPSSEKIICNGMLSYRYMKDSGWPEEKLSIAEAIRYSHLKGFVKSDKKKNIVLLAFSISYKESGSLLNMVYDSFSDLKEDIEIWLKPHPFLQIKKVFELTDISDKDTLFQIKNEPIGNLLPEVRIVIVGESSVCLEALRYGCNILLINTPEWINMSPLKGIENEMIRSVSSTEELKRTVIDIFRKEYNFERYAKEGREIINKFFCLNKESDVPYKFLDILRD